jgi:hypothetical protein
VRPGQKKGPVATKWDTPPLSDICDAQLHRMECQPSECNTSKRARDPFLECDLEVDYEPSGGILQAYRRPGGQIYDTQ